jgi:beta-galactosidase GanA
MFSNRSVLMCAAVVAAATFASGGFLSVASAQGPPIPSLRKQGTATQLVVDGKPFLVLGGELGNSSAASLDYMKPIWPKLRSINVNTVLAPVYWDLVEPVEGRFDFGLVDGLIRDARANRMRLVLLWFGSWKNSMSCYAPAWVKTNQVRFPRAQTRSGQSLEILSPFSDANVQADARAFGALMRHVREADSRERTVVMVQVENEIGMIPEARDRSDVAEQRFREQVPTQLMDRLVEFRNLLAPELRELWVAAGSRTSGTWSEVFGQGPFADEVFMAWHFARFANQVVEAGKAEYPLPMFVNAALIRPGYAPGQYPSAGPLPHLLEIWRAGGPRIDFLSPDIYFPNFAEWCRRYAQAGNPLFVPEAVLDPTTASNALYAIGQHDAIGFSPFSIESLANPEESALARCYAMLERLAPIVLEYQGKGAMAGLLPEGIDHRVARQVQLGGYALNVTFERPAPSAALGASSADSIPGGLVIALGPDEFLFAGTGLIVTFDGIAPGDPIVGILSAQEGTFENGVWKGGRWLNGDQTHQGRHIRLVPGRFDIQRVKLYRYR